MPWGIALIRKGAAGIGLPLIAAAIAGIGPAQFLPPRGDFRTIKRYPDPAVILGFVFLPRGKHIREDRKMTGWLLAKEPACFLCDIPPKIEALRASERGHALTQLQCSQAA